MKTDREVIDRLYLAFSSRQKPEHFTDYTHCEECAEHDELLRGRTVATLELSDVDNPGWDPICFISAVGFAYYLPALAKLVLASAADRSMPWYGSQFLFHLCSDGPRNARIAECSDEERAAVVEFLEHIAETRASLIDNCVCADQMFEALGYWRSNEKA